MEEEEAANFDAAREPPPSYYCLLESSTARGYLSASTPPVKYQPYRTFYDTII